MIFKNIWPLLFLIFIPLIILLYILKKKGDNVTVSSTYLWDIVSKNIRVNTPFEKFKNNLLMYIQILCVIIFILVLLNPGIKMFGKNSGGDVVIVLDNSASMNMKYENTTRFERCILDIEKQVKALSNDSKITFINVNNEIEIVNNATKDKNAVIDSLKKIKKTYFKDNMSGAVDIVKNFFKDMPYNAFFYTDKNLDLKGVNGKIILMHSYGENLSIDKIFTTKQDDFTRASAVVTNWGENKITTDLSIYDGEILLDFQTITLEAYETKNISFEDLKADGEFIRGELSLNDLNLGDNVAYSVINKSHNLKILMVSKGNMFLEKALSTIESAENYKVTPEDYTNNEGYDVYIFDGFTPEIMPKRGNVFMISDKNSEFFRGDIENIKMNFKDVEVTRYVNTITFGISKSAFYELPLWGEEFISSDDKIIGFYGVDEGLRKVVLGFDFHDTDFPLMAEFPIFIHNIIYYLSEASLTVSNNFVCGDNIPIFLNPSGEDLNIVLPDNSTKMIENKFPVKPFEDTYMTGIYTLTQKNQDRIDEAKVSVNYPTDSESSLKIDEISNEGTINNNFYGASFEQFDLSQYILLILLLLVCIEWFVYIKGY